MELFGIALIAFGTLLCAAAFFGDARAIESLKFNQELMYRRLSEIESDCRVLSVQLEHAKREAKRFREFVQTAKEPQLEPGEPHPFAVDAFVTTEPAELAA